MATMTETQTLNEAFFEHISDPGMVKTAEDAVNSYTRTKMRERGFARRILPPIGIKNTDLDMQVSTTKAYKVCEKEPGSPAAISVPLGTLPVNLYIRTPRYGVAFDRILTPRNYCDVDDLRSGRMDVRQIISDNNIKDMLAEEDRKFLVAVKAALGTVDTAAPASGDVQWQTISGGWTRDTLMDCFKIMPSASGRFSVATCLINNVTLIELQKLDRNEAGEFSEEILRNGWTESRFNNKDWVVTIKQDLVVNDEMYMFADPKAIGKSYLLEDTTMYIKREAFLLEFFAYQYSGASIGNVTGLARATIT